VTTVSYLGFLAGPVYVGYWAQAAGLPGAMLAVSVLAGALALLTWPALRAALPSTRPSAEGRASSEEIARGGHGGLAETDAPVVGRDAMVGQHPEVPELERLDEPAEQ
jgi:hypothetical protein